MIEYVLNIDIYGIIFSILLIFANFLIILTGRKREDLEFSKLLILAGIINIVHIIFLFFYPGIYFSQPAGEEIQEIYDYFIRSALIVYIIPIITYGILFILIGIKNRDKQGIILISSGIFWIVYYSFLINSWMGEYSYFFEGTPIMFIRISYLTAYIFGFIAALIFLFYSIKLNEKNLKICGILFLTYSIIQIILFF